MVEGREPIKNKMGKYNYKLNPEFIKKNNGKRIIKEAIEDLDKIMFQVNDLAKEGKIKNIACSTLLIDIEALQDMLKESLEKEKFN